MTSSDINAALTSAVDLAINADAMSVAVARSVTRAQLVTIIAKAFCGANGRTHHCLCRERPDWCPAGRVYEPEAIAAVLALEKAGALK